MREGQCCSFSLLYGRREIPAGFLPLCAQGPTSLPGVQLATVWLKHLMPVRLAQLLELRGVPRAPLLHAGTGAPLGLSGPPSPSSCPRETSPDPPLQRVTVQRTRVT